ncbi:GMC family oxidoreductase [Streptomyces sp. NPDC015125]|uniref:GMC family oxidoreductase n=1 Tax=Streptomyces sp. NPDC015125 TaxID=3364938 RepID=UPI0036F883F9
MTHMPYLYERQAGERAQSREPAPRGPDDGWASAGATGWSYADVLPYFRRSEENERGAGLYHGVGGPLTVSDGRSGHPRSSAFVRAAEQAGHKANEDFRGDTQFGVGRYQLTQRGALRCSAAVAYLHPALDRPNLTVLSSSRANRVEIEGGRAAGVEVERGGGVEVVRAEREVILSAGAYESPKLLMPSGIGPAPPCRPSASRSSAIRRRGRASRTTT